MTWTVKLQVPEEIKTVPSGMSRKGTVYPWLPAIIDDEILAEITTLESGELIFISQQGRARRQYLSGLYLKAAAVLGHFHFAPRDLPLQFRRKIASRLGYDLKLARILTIDKGEKSRVIQPVRSYLGLNKAEPNVLNNLRRWLETTIARKETEIPMVVNAAVHYLRNRKFELPTRNELNSIADKAIKQATSHFIDLINDNLSPEEQTLLESLAKGKTLERFKMAVPQASPNNLAKEIQRIDQIRGYFPQDTFIENTFRLHLESFAELTRRYTTPEIEQLFKKRKRALILCYLINRHAQLLDAIADMAIRVWKNTNHHADDFANAHAKEMAEDYEKQQKVLKSILKLIKISPGPDQLWDGVHRYKSREEYDSILKDIEKTKSWQSCHQSKVEDHYSSLRRFLPIWYRTIPLAPTVLNNSIPEAHEFMKVHDNDSILPTTGCPIDFLEQPWKRLAVRQYSRTGKILRIVKKPYELGLYDATVQGLKQGNIAIPNAHRYSPMVDHLLDRGEFLKNYDDHVKRLVQPATASEYYEPMLERLNTELKQFDRKYDQYKKTFWINKDGTLGFSNVPGQTIPKRLKRIRNEMSREMSRASIFDILLDCHRWTGFLDAFKPTSGRQNMPDEERLRYVLAALYAYGCNCGPAQASQALNISQNQIVYTRRRYMPTQHLMEAASMLTQTYLQTPMAARLGNITNVLMTDSMQVRTLKKSLIARQHHRYLSGKSTLLFQHITENFICLFTQALICNVSEAIHMLAGTLECREGKKPIINISDMAGKSGLVLGLSRLMNIYPYVRVRSRNLKLWGINKKDHYQSIPASITGQIKSNIIDEGWQDVMWILASIEAGTAKPIIILNHLLSQPNHPAAKALEELGKIERSLYVLSYGTDLDLRRFVIRHTSHREHWNKFTRNVQAFGDLIQEKTIEDQEEVFWFLTVVQNAIILWNALSLENIIPNFQMLSEEDLKRTLPTMTGHINFIGQFEVDFNRRPPFKLKTVD
ncbi:MAG: Tn3 family transposase [Lentisphaerae bacterium]|nr:Tn3 family transposase [Lentisphaerota bacterium]